MNRTTTILSALALSRVGINSIENLTTALGKINFAFNVPGIGGEKNKLGLPLRNVPISCLSTGYSAKPSFDLYCSIRVINSIYFYLSFNLYND